MQSRSSALRTCRSCLIALSLLILFTAGMPTIWASWTGDTQLTTDLSADQFPSAIQTADDTLWVVWQSDRFIIEPPKHQYDLYYRTSSNNGPPWSSDTRLTFDKGNDRLPSITQLSNGTIMVFWVSDRNGNNEIYFKTTSNNGATWSPEARFTNDASSDSKPAVTQTKDNRIWVTWCSNRSGDNELYYRTTQDDVSWSNDEQFTNDPMDDLNPSIIQTRNGTIWVTWSSNRTGTNNYDIYFKTSSNNGASWSADTQLTTHPMYDVFPSMAQAKDRDIYLFWHSIRDGGATPQSEIYYRIYNGATWTDDIRFTNDGNLDIGPSVTQGKTDLWVFWTAGRPDVDNNQNIYYNTLHLDVYDVGIRNMWAFTPPLSTSMNRTYKTRFVNVTVEAVNWGSVQESVTVKLYYNDTLFGTQVIPSLGPGDSQKLYFPWHTDDYSTGHYSWRTTIDSVPSEMYTTDNSMTVTPLFRLKRLADINGDDWVDIADCTLMSTLFGLPYTSYPDEDINGDAVINLIDAVLIMVNWSW